MSPSLQFPNQNTKDGKEYDNSVYFQESSEALAAPTGAGDNTKDTKEPENGLPNGLLQHPKVRVAMFENIWLHF